MAGQAAKKRATEERVRKAKEMAEMEKRAVEEQSRRVQSQSDAEALRHVGAISDASMLEEFFNALEEKGSFGTKCNYDRRSDQISCIASTGRATLDQLKNSGRLDDLDDLSHVFMSGCGKGSMHADYSLAFCTEDGIAVAIYKCDVKTRQVTHTKIGGACR